MKKGSLQSLAIPEAKWQEVSVNFITDLPTAAEEEDSVMTVVDRATKMVHLIPCKKTTTAGEAAWLYWQHVVRLHGVPRAIHTDRGAQFVGRWWREIWTLLGTKLRFGTAYHPQSQGHVERMNAVVPPNTLLPHDRRHRSTQVDRLSAYRRDGGELAPE